MPASRSGVIPDLVWQVACRLTDARKLRRLTSVITNGICTRPRGPICRIEQPSAAPALAGFTHYHFRRHPIFRTPDQRGAAVRTIQSEATKHSAFADRESQERYERAYRCRDYRCGARGARKPRHRREAEAHENQGDHGADRLRVEALYDRDLRGEVRTAKRDRAHRSRRWAGTWVGVAARTLRRVRQAQMTAPMLSATANQYRSRKVCNAPSDN
jgi:hypothetical protein